MNCMAWDQTFAAADLILRHLYGFASPERTARSWEVWLGVSKVASLCGEASLARQASENFTTLAFGQTGADEVIRILEAMDGHHDADNIREYHATTLLRSERYARSWRTTRGCYGSTSTSFSMPRNSGIGCFYRRSECADLRHAW